MGDVHLFITLPIWLVYIYGLFSILIREAKKKQLDAYYFLATQSVMFLGIILDTLSNWYIINLPRMSNYFFFIYILGLATILANKFVRLNEEVEELNQNLEQKVQKRTEELSQSLKQVRQLKKQQDGDYFLTSLLLLPLMKHNNNSRTFSSELLTIQKKTFQFRDKEYRIGGDISIVDHLQFQGKQYLVFVNGDAMGKSIQGAGGALVLGVVFNSLIARYKNQTNSELSCQDWLEQVFIDLQNVFESFDGSMLLSMVVGAIEEQTGWMYYLNAEHPWVAL